MSRPRHGEAGATALEFAIVLPLLLLMIYGLVVYSYMFVLQEAINFAAQEAAEAAVRVDPAQEPADYEAVVNAEVRAAAARVLDFLPANQHDRVLGSDGSKVQVSVGPSPSGIGGIVSVGLVFNFRGLFPSISLPGLGPVP